MTIFEWFWRFLPDQCTMPDCKRKGVRGNENIIGDGVVMCDDCLANELRAINSPFNSPHQRVE